MPLSLELHVTYQANLLQAFKKKDNIVITLL